MMNTQNLNKNFIAEDSAGFLTERHPLKLYLFSAVIGVISTFSTIAFVKLYILIRRLIYSTHTFDFSQIAAQTPWWYFFILFLGGGTLIGLAIYHFFPDHGHGHGMPHLLHNFRKRDSISPVEGIGSTLTSSLSIGLGASVGREAPLMFFAGSITSWFCKFFKFEGHYYRVLLCAAIATAFATSLHSSFVAIFFILEVIAYSLSVVDLISITLAVFSGSIIRELMPSIFPPPFLVFSVTGDIHSILFFIVLGLLCGLVALGFILSMKYTVSAHLNSKLPNWVWPIIGGLVLSFIAIVFPDALGLGFELIPQNTAYLEPTVGFIILFIIFKLLSTYFSVGFGFSGGIITPVFILGLFFGSLYGQGVNALFPQMAGDYTMFALGATAAFTGAVIGAPLAMTMVCFELTRDMPLTINIFICVVFAQLILKSLKIGSFYRSQYRLMYPD